MSNRGEMWVHGNSVAIQYPGGDGLEFTHRRRMKKVIDPTTNATVPWSDLLGLRTGPHAIFRGQAGNTNWFHFSIPTPAVIPNAAVVEHLGITIDRISIFFSTPGPQIVIQNILIHDGVAVQGVPRVPDATNLHGPHLDRMEENINSFLIPPIVLPAATAPMVFFSLWKSVLMWKGTLSLGAQASLQRGLRQSFCEFS